MAQLIPLRDHQIEDQIDSIASLVIQALKKGDAVEAKTTIWLALSLATTPVHEQYIQATVEIILQDAGDSHPQVTESFMRYLRQEAGDLFPPDSATAAPALSEHLHGSAAHA